MLIAGTSATRWPIGLAFTPVLATFRLKHTAHERLARTLSAWSITTSLATAGLTIAWGLLATVTTPRIAIGTAGVLLLGTPLLLPRRAHVPRAEHQTGPVAPICLGR
jgi:hypothetical protein